MQQSEEKFGARPLEIAPRFMVVFTDGWSNKGPDPEAMAKEAKAAGFEIFSVGYEGRPTPDAVDVNQYTLDAIATDQQHVFTDAKFPQLIERLRKRNLSCL